MNTHSDVSDRPPDSPNNSSESQPKAFVREEFLAHLAPWPLRWALAVTILSAVADHRWLRHCLLRLTKLPLLFG